MSQENVEFVESFVAGAEDMDKEAILAVLPELIAQTCHPDIEWIEESWGCGSRDCQRQIAVPRRSAAHRAKGVEALWKR